MGAEEQICPALGLRHRPSGGCATCTPGVPFRPRQHFAITSPQATFIEPRSVLKLSASAIPAIRRPSDPQRQVASPSQPAPFSRWGSTSESSAGRICTAVASVIAKYADHRVYNLLFTLVSGKSSHMSPELRRSIGVNHCAVAACISKAARLCGCTSAFV